MTEKERAVWSALVELERAAKTAPGPDSKSNLLPLFRHLDELANELPPETDRELLHYLRRKSYEKARLWLESRRD